MSANKNILKPGSGEMIVMIQKPLDIVLGAYWLTKDVPGAKGEGKYFQSPNAAILARDYDVVDIRASIHVLPMKEKEKYAPFDGKPFQTTVGRLLFNTVLPSDYPFVNEPITKKVLSNIMSDCMVRYGIDAVPGIVNKVKRFGFEYATRSGISWSLDDVSVPEGKTAVIEAARAKVTKIENDYRDGLLSAEEKRRMVIEIWHGTKTEVEKLVEPKGFGARHGALRRSWFYR
jgi:DNA-directed RNA polymerase subunit beta'